MQPGVPGWEQALDQPGDRDMNSPVSHFGHPIQGPGCIGLPGIVDGYRPVVQYLEFEPQPLLEGNFWCMKQ